MDTAPLVVFAFMPLMFIAIWCFTLAIISLFSGWGKLAEQYQSSRQFTGTVYSFQSVRMKRAQYTNALKLGADRTGLYLAPCGIFRPFHKPLLVPWNEIQVHPHETSLRGGNRLTFASVPGITLDLNHRILEDIARHMTPTTRE